MGYKVGMNAKVALGAATVVGMGNWRLDGITTDLLESTAFTDTAKEFMTGLLDYGTVSFAGLYDPADTTGQTVLLSANESSTKVTTIRLYVDSTSYWTPNLTADSDSGMYVTSAAIGFDKSGLGTIDFSGKCTGSWTLV